MNNLMIFEGHEVEAFELKGQVLFNPYHVGECLELNGDAVRKAMSRMNEKQVLKISNSDVTNNHIRKLNNAGENFLTESGVYKLVFKSRKPNLLYFSGSICKRSGGRGEKSHQNRTGLSGASARCGKRCGSWNQPGTESTGI